MKRFVSDFSAAAGAYALDQPLLHLCPLGAAQGVQPPEGEEHRDLAAHGECAVRYDEGREHLFVKKHDQTFSLHQKQAIGLHLQLALLEFYVELFVHIIVFFVQNSIIYIRS